jgi:hypothetical protein
MEQIESDTNTHTFGELVSGTIYRFKVAAINSIGQGEWSNIVSFYAATTPSDPQNFKQDSQSEDHISLSWELPASDGGCPVLGYRVWMENILEPGLKIVYNGIKQSTQTKLTLYYPNVKPGQYYKFLIQSKNCGLFSAGESLTLASGSVP